jgi:hypoxanthine phosphoribosyltransferase
MKNFITWDEFKTDCHKLAEKISQNHETFQLWGISRGGLFIALQVAYFLDCTVGIIQRKPKGGYTAWPMNPGNKKDDIICDDIYESGKTYNEIQTILGWDKAEFYALYVKISPEAKSVSYKDNFHFIKTVRLKEYLILPWEVNRYGK